MSTDYYLHAERDKTCIYIGYSWGAGVNEPTVEDRKAVADWISEHLGEPLSVFGEVLPGYTEVGEVP